jgi:hypothetical protein
MSKDYQEQTRGPELLSTKSQSVPVTRSSIDSFSAFQPERSIMFNTDVQEIVQSINDMWQTD